MAARLNPGHQQSVRDKIQGSQLVNALQNHALGKNTLEATQIQAAKILLDKIVSNAPTDINSNVDLKGDVITKVEYLVVYPTDADVVYPTK